MEAVQAFELPEPSEEVQALLNTMSGSVALTPAAAAYVTFSSKPKMNKKKSQPSSEANPDGQGRPVWEPEERIQILCPGDKDTIVDRPVRELDKYVYREKYTAFRNNKSQDSGTPLDVWGGVSEERVLELAHFKIKTVEQLAMVPDGNLPNLGMNARAEREKAKAYLAIMKEGMPVAEVAAKADRLAAENVDLKKRLEALEKLAERSQTPGPEEKKAKAAKA